MRLTGRLPAGLSSAEKRCQLQYCTVLHLLQYRTWGTAYPIDGHDACAYADIVWASQVSVSCRPSLLSSPPDACPPTCLWAGTCYSWPGSSQSWAAAQGRLPEGVRHLTGLSVLLVRLWVLQSYNFDQPNVPRHSGDTKHFSQRTCVYRRAGTHSSSLLQLLGCSVPLNAPIKASSLPCMPRRLLPAVVWDWTQSVGCGYAVCPTMAGAPQAADFVVW